MAEHGSQSHGGPGIGTGSKPSAAPPGAGVTGPEEPLIIRSYSKVIFFWPIAAASLLFWMLAGGAWNPVDLGIEKDARWAHMLGLWWYLVFAFNLTAFSFDFGRRNFITFVVLVAAVVLGITALDMAVDAAVWGGIYDFFGTLNILVNANFFLCMFLLFGGFIGLSLVRSRLDYWELKPNELVHKHGFLGDVRAYSTLNMQIEKEIPDVFEWLLFGSGRIIFKPGSGGRDGGGVLVVETVYRVNRAEAKIKQFLGVVNVEQTKQPGGTGGKT
jgi:hypothetical protein